MFVVDWYIPGWRLLLYRYVLYLTDSEPPSWNDLKLTQVVLHLFFSAYARGVV